MKKFLSFLLCVLTVLGLWAFPAAETANAAASPEITMVCANPGENCSTEVGIGWHASFDCTNCKVEYKKAADKGWEGVSVADGTYNDTDYRFFLGNAFPTAQKGTVFSEEHKFLNYDAALSGLEPGTKYKYRVSDGLGGYSVTHFFQTSGAADYSIVWISDFHTYTPLGGRLNAANSAVAYAASQAANTVSAVFSTGDTTAWGGSYYFWKQLYGAKWMKNFLYIDTNGNHDNMSNDHKRDTFNYFRVMHSNPENCFLGGSTEPFEPGVVYWFLYGDILWFVLDNETMDAERLPQIQDWAGSVIENMQGKYRYIFISEHYHWFNGDTGSTMQYGKWKDFCDKYGVDATFSGHNHVYCRTHKVYQGQVVDPASEVGTYYFQAASSDCERGTTAEHFWPPTHNADIIACTYKNFDNPARTHAVSVMDFGSDGIRLRMFGSENANPTSPDFQLKDSVFIQAKRPAPTQTEPSVPSEEPAVVQSGDVNGDGAADNLDASIILQYDTGLPLPDSCDIKAGDVNGDGSADNLDASMILQYDAGILTG